MKRLLERLGENTRRLEMTKEAITIGASLVSSILEDGLKNKRARTEGVMLKSF